MSDDFAKTLGTAPNPVRFSHLRCVGLKSAAHLAANVSESTPAAEKGTAAHAIIFGTRRVVGYFEGKQRRGKEWDAFQADNGDAEILTHSDYADALGMATAVQSHEMAMRALEGTHEKTLLWLHGGVECRATPDAWTSKRITELKTSFSSHPDKFSYLARKVAYGAQLDYYATALRSLKLADPQEHLIVAVESAPPYVVTIFRMSERALEVEAKRWRGWFEKLLVHKASGVYGGYSDAVIDIDVPEEGAELIYADAETTGE